MRFGHILELSVIPAILSCQPVDTDSEGRCCMALVHDSGLTSPWGSGDPVHFVDRLKEDR